MKLALRCFGACESIEEAKQVFLTLAHHLKLDLQTAARIEPYWKVSGLWDIGFSWSGDFTTTLEKLAPRIQWSPLEEDDMIEPWAVWSNMTGARPSKVDARLAWIHLQGISESRS